MALRKFIKFFFEETGFLFANTQKIIKLDEIRNREKKKIVEVFINYGYEGFIAFKTLTNNCANFEEFANTLRSHFVMSSSAFSSSAILYACYSSFAVLEH